MRYTQRQKLALLAGLVALFFVAALPFAFASSKPKAKNTQTPGGANQVQGLKGKVGQMLFTGQWRFQVQNVQQVDSYTLKVPTAENDYAKYHDVAEYDNDTHVFTPKTGYTLIAADCLAKNAQTKVKQLDFFYGSQNTALTDDQGQSYQPIAYDMQTKSPCTTKPMLPGSAEKITILFAVPPGTKLQDMVVTLRNWDDGKSKDVRVSLAK